jgi:hypothetical protein
MTRREREQARELVVSIGLPILVLLGIAALAFRAA